MADYPLDSSGSRFYSSFPPVAPYTDPKNPNYSNLIDNPGLINTSFPIKQGSNTSQIQYNKNSSSIYQYYTNVNNEIASSGKKVPYKTFKSDAERLAFIQGQIAAGNKGKPFYSFLGTGQ